jgi:periplasmic copper chaperone A
MGSEVIFGGHSRALAKVHSRVSSKNDLRPHFLVFGMLAALVTAGCTDRVDAGRQLYMTHGCAVCHGSGGRGDGPSAARLAVPPTDFAKVDQYRNGSSAEDIAATIRYGPGTPGPMPPYAHISEEDARLLAAWIVSLQGAPPAAAAASGIAVRDAWVRESSATRTVSSGYLTIDNRAAHDLALIGVAVEGAGRAELHTVVQDGDAVMRPVDSLTIPARSSVELAPGGTHVMLFDVNPPLVAGNAATMTLTFGHNQQETVRAVVRPLAAMSVR